MAGFSPLTIQGNLNRVATHIVVTSYPTLNVSAGYMGKTQAVLTFEGPFVEQIETATGVVNSPKPFVQAQLVISLLRSQALGNAWIAQSQVNSTLGTVVTYPDSTVFQPISLSNCSIQDIDPGAYDGVDPIAKVTLKGTFYINSSMWAGITGALGNLSALL